MQLHFESALLPEGWRNSVKVQVADDGTILSVEPERARGQTAPIRGVAIPGIPNVHCHAHQRAFAGLAERSDRSDDSFWSWRETMYRCLGKMTPDLLRSVASQLYVELLKGGYTNIAEFHYLHHDVDGSRYGNPAELGVAILEAADASGIGITCLPTLYAYSDFGGAPHLPAQRRFVNDASTFLEIHARLDRLSRDMSSARTGIAFHSLRAVDRNMMREVIDSVPEAPVHIHVAEQIGEVKACRAWSDRRPVEWLLDEFDIDARWCAVHATHMTDAEGRALAESGAVAGICPTTEANLGDGVFNAEPYFARNGAFGIGSDSNVSTEVSQELRLFEYGQRLHRGRRNVLTNSITGVPSGLLRAALSGGAQASGANIGTIAPGYRADIVVLDSMDARLYGRTGDDLVDCWVFSGGTNVVRDVLVAGKRLVRDGRHENEREIYDDFRAAMTKLL